MRFLYPKAKEQFLNKSNKSDPFFIYLALNAPHGPYDVAPKYFKKYLEAGLPLTTAKQYGLIEKIDENLKIKKEDILKV